MLRFRADAHLRHKLHCSKGTRLKIAYKTRESAERRGFQATPVFWVGLCGELPADPVRPPVPELFKQIPVFFLKNSQIISQRPE